MGVSIGVDVGGTFTKAVACETGSGRVVARAVVPTTHRSAAGVAEGVIAATGAVADEVRSARLGRVGLVAHSTTQAVNALLEGDTAVVGVLGLGRRPDLRRARRRTEVGELRVAPGRKLAVVHRFLDVTGRLDRARIADAVRGLVDDGAEALCVSEAFGVEDARGEWLALEAARELGVPACGGHELTGLYGLEMRTVTGALNASILPSALSTAGLVEDAVARDIEGVPLLVMRGDGGAADLGSMRRHPLLTAFSGPAASVAGALRHLGLYDGVVVEVGGTSTNVSAVKGGRPVLSYVRVLDHVTCIRSLDVRVAGVAGGSLLRVRRRLGSLRVEEVGPRSAHIAGLPYCCFAAPGRIEGARAALVAPLPGDPADYLVLEAPDGARFALTPTCAANALGQVPRGAHARGDADAARAGFRAASRLIGLDWRAVAQRVLDLAALRVSGVVSEVAREQRLGAPALVGLGGGAGALVPGVGAAMGLDWRIAPDAEVISSVGDATSLIRVEIERTLRRPSAAALSEIHAEAERAAIDAGAAPGTVQTESTTVPERGALRTVAFGAVALDSAPAAPGHSADEEALALAAKEALGESPELLWVGEFYAVFVAGAGEPRFAVLDRRGSLALEGRGLALSGSGAEVAAALRERLPALVRHLGPVRVAPSVRIVRATQLVDLSPLSSPERALEAAVAQCERERERPVVALLSRT